MSHPAGALAWAQAQVAAVRDDPHARLELIDRTYHGPTGRAPRHLPFRRAALSFMRWQAERGLLNPLDGSPPGSPWWRAVNERLLAGWLRIGRPRRRSERGAVVTRPSGCGWSSSRSRRRATGTAPTTRASWAAIWSTRELADAEGAPGTFLHERRARPLSSMPTRSLAHRASRWGDSPRSPACSAIPGSGWRGRFCRSAACFPTVIRSSGMSTATSQMSSASVGCSTTR